VRAASSRESLQSIACSSNQPGRRHDGGIVVRNGSRPDIDISAVRQAIWSVDKNQPVALYRRSRKCRQAVVDAVAEYFAVRRIRAARAAARVDRLYGVLSTP